MANDRCYEWMQKMQDATTLRRLGFALSQSLEDQEIGREEAESLQAYAVNRFLDMSNAKIHERFDPPKKEESEIYYTGGGIWCGVIPLGFGLWFGGDLNGHGTIYKSYDSAVEGMGEDAPDFVRYTDDEDFSDVVNLWEQAIEYERTNIHNLAGWCDKWMEDNEKCRVSGTLNPVG